MKQRTRIYYTEVQKAEMWELEVAIDHERVLTYNFIHQTVICNPLNINLYFIH